MIVLLVEFARLVRAFPQPLWRRFSLLSRLTLTPPRSGVNAGFGKFQMSG
jgi:hypothetical protein